MIDSRYHMFDDGDPRLSGDFVREIPSSGDDGDVVLVGVVHDHPASKFRVARAIEAADPDVLALELPPLAVPVFVRYADDVRTPPAHGGEMSTAIQAADTDEVVGIDGPTLRFLGRLAAALYRDGASFGTVRSVLRGLRSIAGRAVVCRTAVAVERLTGVLPAVDAPVAHDVRWSDEPQAQAKDERNQVRRARAIADVFGTSEAVRFRESAREAHMAERLSALRRDGPVVAVVGIDHLDPLTTRLEPGRSDESA